VRLFTIKTWRASTSPSSRRADQPLEQRRRMGGPRGGARPGQLDLRGLGRRRAAGRRRL